HAPAALGVPRITGRTTAAPLTVAPAATPGVNVILYVADTLRRDRLGCYGYGKPTSPRIDAFTRGAVVFDDAFAQASWTRPATASLLTGRYPAEHGARSLMSAIRPDVPTLASVLRAAGYDTAAFVTNLNVAGRFGFARDFGEFSYLEERDDSEGVYASAAELDAVALPWVEAHRERPFFLYLHASDVHAPYRPPADLARRFVPAGLQPTITPLTPLRSLLQRPALAVPDNVAFISALY